MQDLMINQNHPFLSLSPDMIELSRPLLQLSKLKPQLRNDNVCQSFFCNSFAIILDCSYRILTPIDNH